MQPFSIESEATPFTPLQPKEQTTTRGETKEGRQQPDCRIITILSTTTLVILLIVLALFEKESASVAPISSLFSKTNEKTKIQTEKVTLKDADGHAHQWSIESDQTATGITCGTTWQSTIAAGTFRDFQFRAPVAASVTIDTCGSLFDTVLSVRRGTTQVWGCDNCGPCGRQASGTLAIGSTLTSGLVYTIRLSGASGTAGGMARLRVDCQGLPATCGTTLRATTQPQTRAIYTLTVPSNAVSVTFDTCQAGYDTQMFVFSGVNPGRNQIWSCDDCGQCFLRETITFQVQNSGSTAGVPNIRASQPYTVGVGGYANEAGNLVLDVRCELRGSSSPTHSPVTRRPTTLSPTQAPTRPQPTSVPTTSSPTTLSPTRSPVPTTTGTSCGPRIRRDWMEISQADRDLYINGFLELYRQRKIATLTRTHNNNEQWAHSVNMFFPWHRYFLWEIEEQIRSLGGAYSCFTLPYWDWTRNSGNERNNPMFGQGLGGNGASNRQWCLQTGAFRQGQYEITSGGCLMRQFDNSALPFPTTQGTMQNLMSQSGYVQFRETIEFGGHAAAHNFLGGFEGIIATMQSPDDPFFYLLHGFVDFVWALWQDCHDYDLVAPSAITNTIYPTNELDTPLEYANGQDSMVNAPWARVTATNRITPRMMHNIRGSFLQYQYHTTAIARSGLNFAGRCTLQGSWIIQPTLTEVNTLLANRDAGESVAIELDAKARTWRESLEKNGEILGAQDGGYGNRRKKWRRKKFWRQKMWKKLTAAQRDNMIAQLACEQSKYLEYEHGGPEPCEFDPDTVQGCGPAPKYGPDKFRISLKALLRKRGVRKNKCLKRIRRTFYKWATLMGPSALRGLCNGAFDKRYTCNFDGI